MWLTDEELAFGAATQDWEWSVGEWTCSDNNGAQGAGHTPGSWEQPCRLDRKDAPCGAQSHTPAAAHRGPPPHVGGDGLMAVSRRLRYEVLRRDNHTCRYCGGTATDVALTVDHVIPTALGGSDDPSNLVTACQPCNAGKSASSADAPIVADVASDALRWARAMTAAQAARQLAREREANKRAGLNEAFRDAWGARGGYVPDLPDDPWVSLAQFRDAGLSWDDIAEAIDVSTRTYRRDPWRYFCGVCWRMVTNLQETARALLEAEEG